MTKHNLCETLKFLEQQAALPPGSQAIAECPALVTEELNAAGVGAGTFFSLLPLILELFKNEQLRELIKKLLEAFKPKPA